MNNNLFTNAHILDWLNYYSDNYDVDLERVKILDITRKNKNLIPTVESHKYVLVFTEAGHPDIFYRMFNAGLGECTCVYNEGSDPSGPIKENKIYDMINRGINASAAMLIINPKARNTYRFGMDNQVFASGSVHYVGSEIRAVILSKMEITEGKNLCIITAESIAIEAALHDGEGSIIAVEYNKRDGKTLEDNVNLFGVNNVTIIDHVDDETMKDLPIPETTMLVASASMEQEIACLLRLNPKMEFVVYTLDFNLAGRMNQICTEMGLKDVDITQITVAKMNAKGAFDIQPAPWLITCPGE